MGIPVTGTDVSGGSGGTPTNTFGLWGDSSSGVGVIGTTSATGKAGVEGFNVGIDRQGGGVGVFGFSHITHGVKGESFGEAGVYGFAPSSIGLLAEGGDIGLHAKAIQSAVGIGHIGLLAESIGTDNQVITDAYIAVHTTAASSVVQSWSVGHSRLRKYTRRSNSSESIIRTIQQIGI